MSDSRKVSKGSLLIVGHGYLGRRVAHMAMGSGYATAATSRRTAMREPIEASGCEFVRFDINSHVDRLPAADKWVWCPAFDRTAGVSVREAVVEGLERALSRAERRPRIVIFTSTTGVYHQTSGEWVDESSPCEPVGDSGKAHVEAEHRLLDWSRAQGTNAVVLRLSGLYGPGRTIRKASIEAGETIACHPDTWLNLVHIEDAASACLMALDASASGTYCVTDDRPILRREYYESLARMLGAPAPRFRISDAPDFGGNKRVSNRLVKERLGWQPKFKDFVQGLSSDLS